MILRFSDPVFMSNCRNGLGHGKKGFSGWMVLSVYIECIPICKITYCVESTCAVYLRMRGC